MGVAGNPVVQKNLIWEKQMRRADLKRRLKKYWVIYLLVAIPLTTVFIYSYIPMVGILMAFKDYKVTLGFMGIFTSPNVGLENFKDMLVGPPFLNALKNTFIISLLKMIFCFPAPILFALMLNEVRSNVFRRSVQTICYMPNFLSMVIVYGITRAIISPQYGLLNMVRLGMGLETISYLADPIYFRSILVIMDILKSTGWSAIIYLAAIAGVDQGMYEAAKMDGATRLQRIRYITLPGISSMIVFLLILRVGELLSVNFEQIFLLYSPTVYSVGDVIATYTYRVGLLDYQYGFGTAVGLFNSVTSLLLVILTNTIAKRLGQQGVW